MNLAENITSKYPSQAEGIYFTASSKRDNGFKLKKDV